MKKSIAVNAILNAIKTICTIIFPLITFPYVSRVLHAEMLGAYNYCSSIINYFSLLAGLGVSTYAIREGSKYRNDRIAFSQFASEIFTINIISTIISYMLLGLLFICSDKLSPYRALLAVLSVSIVFNTLGCEWIFSVYEEYGYITLRSIVFQILSMILLFVFVHSEADLIKYAGLTVLSSSGANVVNCIARRKHCDIKININKRVLVHCIPIIILFSNTLATNIYINSDMTLVGYISGNYYAGLYSISSKLYFIIKNLLSSIIIVSVPRLSEALVKNPDEYKSIAGNVFDALLVFVMPIVVGMFSIANNIVILLFGEEYSGAIVSLKILSVALLFCMLGWFYTSCVLIPNKQEKKVLCATIIAATSNVVLNLLLIPRWQHNAAALTTVIAEAISACICFYYGRKTLKIKIKSHDIISIVVGNIAIILVCSFMIHLIDSLILSTFLCVLVSTLIYGLVLFTLKNSIAVKFVDNLMARRNKSFDNCKLK